MRGKAVGAVMNGKLVGEFCPFMVFLKSIHISYRMSIRHGVWDVDFPVFPEKLLNCAARVIYNGLCHLCIERQTGTFCQYHVSSDARFPKF